MNPNKIGTVIVVAMVLFLVSLPVVRKIHWAMLYNEAERVQPVVWQLAVELQVFKDRRGQLPAALNELPDADHQFHVLTNFVRSYTPDEKDVFSLTVNSKYGFLIYSNLNPQWDVKLDR